MFKNKFESINYYKNIDVGIDVTSICNYKCWYCNSHYAKQYQNTILTLKTLDIIIHHLKIINKKYNIYLLGGEPLLHPHLKDIINKLKELNIVNINLITNAYKPLLDIDLHYVASFHPSIADADIFLHNILNQKNRIDYVYIMGDLKYKAKNDYLINKLNQLNIKYIIKNIWFEKTDKLLYYPDCTRKPEVFNLNDKIYNRFELFNNKLNSFTNWYCEQKAILFKINGMFSINCDDFTLKDFYNLNFFKEYRLNVMKCNKKWCVDDRLLCCRKFK